MTQEHRIEEDRSEFNLEMTEIIVFVVVFGVTLLFHMLLPVMAVAAAWIYFNWDILKDSMDDLPYKYHR